MIVTLLALLQYPLLASLSILIGLVVYGGDYASPGGYLYLVPLLFLPFLAPRLGPRTQARLRRWARPCMGMGLVLGAVAYRPLHLGLWDEHSLLQAVTLAAFATVSLAASWLAAGQLTAADAPPPWMVAMSLGIVAACFYVARWYPHAPIMGAALCLACGVATPWRRDAVDAPARLGRFGFLDATCFGVAAAMADVVWDMDLEPASGFQLAMALLAAGVAVLAAPWLRPRSVAPAGTVGRSGYLALALAGAASIATAAHPVFLLSPLRQILLGLALGVLLTAVLDRAWETAGPVSLMRAWLAINLGVAVSSQFSLQLEAFPAARLVYLVPAAVGLALAARRAQQVAADLSRGQA